MLYMNSLLVFMIRAFDIDTIIANFSTYALWYMYLSNGLFFRLF